MSDRYIPKVGDEFEWSYKGAASWTRAKANCVTDKAIGYEDSKGWIVTVCKSCNFRPIPTNADVEREQLCNLLYNETQLSFDGASELAKEIQRANFTIPKKVKRSEIYIALVSDSWTVEHANNICDVVCELLGDLVERDL